MSIQDEARAEAERVYMANQQPQRSLLESGFMRGAEWQASRKPEAAPSDPDWMLECSECGMRLDALEELRGSGEFGAQVARDMAAGAGWTSDPANDDDWCPKCSASRTSQPVQVEVTDEMAVKAGEVVCKALSGKYPCTNYHVHQGHIRTGRAALTAALGGGE